MKEANPRLIAAKVRVEDAKDEYDAVLQEVQAECPHTLVVHNSGHTPQRICVHCRLEEKGTHWSYEIEGHWRARHGQETRLGNEDHRIIVPRERDFFKLRDPREPL